MPALCLRCACACSCAPQVEIRGQEGVTFADTITVIYRVANVVGKTFLSARTGTVPEDQAVDALNRVVRRIRKWAAATNVGQVLKGLPPTMRQFQNDFVAEWQVRCRAMLQAAPKPAKSTQYVMCRVGVLCLCAGPVSCRPRRSLPRPHGVM